MSFRPQKMASLVRETIAAYLREVPQREFGIISVTEVEISADLQYATIYVSALKNAPKALEVLQGKRKEMRAALQKNLTTYRIPEIRFRIDDRSERGERIEKLLDDSIRDTDLRSMQGEDA